MSSWRFILRSLLYHWRINAAVALGVMAATAVLTGALLVGDSVRGSLRRLTLDRLGQIDEVLVTDRFFRAALAEEIAGGDQFATHFTAAVPAIVLPRATVESVGAEPSRRSSHVLVVGSGESFWQLGDPAVRPQRLPGQGEIVLNEPLARELGVQQGDRVVLRLASSNQVPADSPLGRKTDRIRSLAQLTVIEILPADSLGRFSLRSTQYLPRNAYVSLESLQRALNQPEKINTILVAGGSAGTPPSNEARQVLEGLLQPTLDDYGFTVHPVRRTFHDPQTGEEQVAYEYFSFTTDRLILDEAAETAAARAFAPYGAQPLLTYLANSIEQVSGEQADRPGIPYSMITAVDSQPEFGPLLAADGQPIPLADDEIVLNRWAAEDLQAEAGDRIRIRYFEPETTHGVAREQSAEFRLKAVVPLTEPAQPYRRSRAARYEQPPTLANDPDLTPEVEGITDQDTIENWDAPFPVDYSRIRRQDDEYWKNHRTTPKAFVSLAAGQRLWGSRFGNTTSLRIPAREAVTVERLEDAFRRQLAASGTSFGFEFLPVKQQQLEASAGATPFDVLFLFLSFFIIAAALMLVALLFRLGIEQRASELGTLLAAGLPRRLTTRLMTTEGTLVAAVGGLLGVAAGIGYAWLMLVGLRTWWLGAVAVPFLLLYVTPWSLLIGYVSGVLVSALTIAVSVRYLRRLPVRQLLAGQASTGSGQVPRSYPRLKLVSGVLLVLAGLLAALAVRLGGEAQAGMFVGSGAAVLAGLLTWIWQRLRSGGATNRVRGSLALTRLALRNAARSPGRSTMTIGLMAIASFLILAMSCFRLDPSREGAGGFALVAESSEPIFADLNHADGRDQLLADRAEVLEGATVFSLRLRPGDDASCRNLYQATQPRVLGLTPALIAHFDQPDVQHFAWAETAAETATQQSNPWRLLDQPLEHPDDPIPVVLDKNTALWSLHLRQGVGQQFDVRYDDGTEVRFRVVGLLSNSIFQDSLLVSQSHFVRRFPRVSGYQYFLLQTPPERKEEVARVLEDRLGDQGFQTTSTRQLLEELLAVQNTYLSTFQSLGALGLLLGTFGLATVQLRNVLERRSELALLRAAGFRRSRLAQMVLLEHALLLLGGLASGTLAALLAVLPHMLLGGATIPLADLLVMLALVLAVGLLSGLAAVRSTLRAPLLPALRGE